MMNYSKPKIIARISSFNNEDIIYFVYTFLKGGCGKPSSSVLA